MPESVIVTITRYPFKDFSENIKRIPSHRILAINRGENEKAIRVKIEKPEEKIIELEYELFNPEVDDFKTLESILELGKLNFITNKITKYQRFKNRLKEVAHD